MQEILAKLNAELAEVKSHKGYDVTLTIKTKDGEKKSWNLGNGTWDTQPTEENGILTLRNNKGEGNIISNTATEVVTAFDFERTNIEVSEISEFSFSYKRNVTKEVKESE